MKYNIYFILKSIEKKTIKKCTMTHYIN